MPMPPMPTKWIGPMSRGSFMQNVLLPTDASARRYHTRHPQHQIGEPVGGVEHAGRPWRPRPSRRAVPGSAASAAISAASRSGVKSAWSRRIAPPACSSTPALARWSWSSACGSGTRMRGPADRGEFRHGRGAGARDHQMARRHPRRQIGEERRDLGRDADAAHRCRARAAISSSRACCTMLQPRPQTRLEPLDRRRHDVRHDARALAAAEHQQAEAARPASERRDRASPPPRSPPAAPDCRCGSSWRPAPDRLSSTPAKPVAIAVTRGASKRLARPITAFCSWIMVGMPRRLAASSGGTVG